MSNNPYLTYSRALLCHPTHKRALLHEWGDPVGLLKRCKPSRFWSVLHIMKLKFGKDWNFFYLGKWWRHTKTTNIYFLYILLFCFRNVQKLCSIWKPAWSKKGMFTCFKSNLFPAVNLAAANICLWRSIYKRHSPSRRTVGCGEWLKGRPLFK